MASAVSAVLHTKHFAHQNKYEIRVENKSNDSHDTLSTYTLSVWAGTVENVFCI